MDTYKSPIIDIVKPQWLTFFTFYDTFHMWLMDHPNPSKFEQSWECIFLKGFIHMNTK